jgi:hypothetical protein
MKKSAIMFVLCAWVLLEPPLDRNSNPNPKAPLKEWQRPSLRRKYSKYGEFFLLGHQERV